MVYMVTITSQGQISIPAPIRRKLRLSEHRRAIVTEKDWKVVVEPVVDLLSLKGSLKTTKKATPLQIRKAFEKYLADHAVGLTS